MFAALGSSRWTVSEQSSTDTSTATDVGGAPQIVVQAGDAGGAGQAAQPEQRHPLDVGPQPDAGGDPGVDRRHRHAGHGREHDQVDVLRRQTGLVQSAQQRLAAEFDGDRDERVVGGGEAVEAGIAIERQRQVPGRHLRALVQPAGHRAGAALGQAQLGEQVGQLRLGVAVRR